MKAGIRYILFALGALISVGAPAVATLLCFPLWQAKGGGAVLSGFTFFLLLLSAIPLFKLIKKALATPSAPIVWLIIFVTFFLFSRIAREVTVISLVGAVSNLIGAILFKVSKIKRTDK